MVLPLRKPRPSAAVVKLPAPHRVSFLTPRGLLLLAAFTGLSLGLLLQWGVYWAGFDAGQRAADEDAVFRAVQLYMRQGLRVASLTDTVHQLRRSMATQAAQRLPPHVLDSLRERRWSTP